MQIDHDDRGQAPAKPTGPGAAGSAVVDYVALAPGRTVGRSKCSKC